MKNLLWGVLIVASSAMAQDGDVHVKAHTVPLPAGASTELQQAIRDFPLPVYPNSETVPKSRAEWKAIIDGADGAVRNVLPDLIAAHSVKISCESIGGVDVYTVLPENIAENHKNRLFVFVHGGTYIFGAGESGLIEAILIASQLSIPVVSIDYRMPPDFPYPTAVDDVVSAYREIIKAQSPTSIMMGGTSAGGGLAMAAVHRMRELDIPVPAAIFAGTAWVDLSKTGDTLFSNEGLDRVLVTYDGLLGAAARMYANGEDLTNPLISPVYGNFRGFPPTILFSGTRDLFLSDVSRIHRKLRAADVRADLHVFDGMSHAGYLLVPDSPEADAVYTELNWFINQHVTQTGQSFLQKPDG